MPEPNNNQNKEAENAMKYALAKLYLAPGNVLYYGESCVDASGVSNSYVLNRGFVNKKHISVRVEAIRQDGIVVSAINDELSLALNWENKKLIPYDSIDVKRNQIITKGDDIYSVGDYLLYHFHMSVSNGPHISEHRHYRIESFTEDGVVVFHHEAGEKQHMNFSEMKSLMHFPPTWNGWPSSKPETLINLGEIGKQFINTVKSFNFKAFDELTSLLKPLKHIRFKRGYVLDAFESGSYHGSSMQLYVCQEGSQLRYNPLVGYVNAPDTREFEDEFRSKPHVFPQYRDEMYITGMLPYEIAETIPSFEDYLDIDFTKESIWEAYLIKILPAYMPKGWHGAYGHCDYIFGYDDLLAIKDVDCSAYNNNRSVLPQVIMKGESEAILSVSYFNAWSGLCTETVKVTRLGRALHFGELTRKVLIEYDCGIRF